MIIFMKNILLAFFLLLSLHTLGQNCTLTVNLSSSSPAICSGSAVVLTAKAAAGTAPYTYVWSTGETTSSINVNKAGTYTVTVTDNNKCSVTKDISVSTAPVPDAPTVSNASVCLNTAAVLTATSPGGTYQWYDSGGKFLFTGNPFTTPVIKANTTFYVETTINGCTSARIPVNVSLVARPTVKGDTVCAGNGAVLKASGGDSYEWYAQSSGGASIASGPTFNTPPLLTTTIYYVVSIANGCTSARTPVTARVGDPPQEPTAKGTTICYGSSANLHADAPAGIFDWFDVPVGGTSLISSPDYTTPPLTATATYYVQTSLNGCTSARKAVVVKVNQIPIAPRADASPICPGSSATLTVESPDPAVTYQWYNSQFGGSPITSGTTFTTPVLNTSTTYYVDATNGSCTSNNRTAVRVTVYQPTPAPSAAGAIICPGSSTTLTAVFPGGTYQWFTTPTGGTAIYTGDSFITPVLNNTTTYYVQTAINGCLSARSPVTVTVSQAPAAPTAGGTAVCSGNPAVLTASGADNGIYEWYADPTGGSPLAASQVFVTPSLSSTTTYYVQTTSNSGCSSARAPVTVTVAPIPSKPKVNGASVCSGNPVTLTASAPSGTLEWYDDPTAGNLVHTGNTFTIPSLTVTTTYYVRDVTGTCVSGRVPVTASVISGPDPAFIYPSGTFCKSSSLNPTPVINDPSGGTFTSSPDGLVFTDTHTGQINIAASTVGAYVVSFKSNGICANITNADIYIAVTPSTKFSYNGPFCQDDVNPLPKYPVGASAGNFTASPAGLVFKNNTTGEINLSATKPGTYTIVNNSAVSGCSTGSDVATVTIYQRVTVDAGPDQTVGQGSTVQLAGKISGISSAKWSGGTGTFSDRNDPAATYTPAAGETRVSLTLTTANPPGPCGSKSASVTITINGAPSSPIAPGATACFGSSVTLSALGPGGNYRWYSSPTSNAPLSTKATFSTPPVTADVTYYVSTTINGATSARTAVPVTVIQPPAAPAVTAPPACYGNSTILTASGSTGTYQWFDAPVGGNEIWDNSTFTTPALTTNTSYYVQTTVGTCTSPRTKVDVTVNTLPSVTSSPTGDVCSSQPQNYAITADMPGTTFSWSRDAVAGISNPAVTGQASSTITETLTNITLNNINVTYIIIPVLNGCSGTPFPYVVTVYPSPVVTNPDSAPICNQTATNYAIAFNISGVSAKWSRGAVAGISNSPVSGQAAPVIREVLFNTTNAPVNVTYTFTYGNDVCTGLQYNHVVTVNPQVNITSAAANSDPVCSGEPQNYQIISNIPSATFSWSRDAVTGISNPAVTGQTSSIITETLVNTTNKAVKVTYNITPSANGCPGKSFTYTVTVNPQPAKPVANANTPVCVGSTIHLQTAAVPKATYLWITPGGKSLSEQNPDITNVTAADAGTYHLFVTVGGCTSEAGTTQVAVHNPPVVKASAPQTQCITDPYIQLTGSITGGTTTGIWLLADGATGKFSSPIDVQGAKYYPSQKDKDAGSVTLQLQSTSPDDCTPGTDFVTIKFAPAPGLDAGPDLKVCAQDISVPINGTIFVPGSGYWTITKGTGHIVNANQPVTSYVPSANDITAGSVTLTLHANTASECYTATDDLVIYFIPPPTVDAGGTRYVLKGNQITLTPTVSDPDVTYLWSPNVDINDVTAKNPVITGDVDITYTLTVTDKRGCTSSNQTNIKVSPVITPPNAFTPNGDGINDQWNIVGLIAYPNATVDIFDRYGQKVFHSLSYPKAWDGTYNGKLLPTGTYYYVINTNLYGLILSGYVAIIR